MKYLLAILLFFPLGAHAFECEGCGALSSAAAKLKTARTAGLRAHDEAQMGVSKAIRGLRRKMDGSWTIDQVAEVVKALRTETDAEYRQFIIAPNAILFQDNRELLVKALEKLPEIEAKDILFDIDAMIRTNEFGNNSPDPERKRSKK